MNEDAKNIAKNLDLLMNYFKDTQAKVSSRCVDVSQKTISNLLNPKDDTAPNLDIVSDVANNAYKIPTWMLLLPDPPIEIFLNHQFQKHIDNFLHADKSTRDFVSHVLEGPALYDKKVNEKNGNKK